MSRNIIVLSHMAAVIMRESPLRPPQSAYPSLTQGAASRIHLAPLSGGHGERCASLGAGTREKKVERGGSLGPTSRNVLGKQDWSMPMEFSSTASKLKEFPKWSARKDLPLSPEKKPEIFVVPKPPSSGSSRSSSRPSSRLGSAALRSKDNQDSQHRQSGVAESNACERGAAEPAQVPAQVPGRQAAEELDIGDQTSAVIRQVLPLVQRALASSNPEVFDSSLRVLLRLAKVFGQESISAHSQALLDGVEKRLKETPASAKKNAPRVLQMLGDVGGTKTIQEISRRFPELVSELSFTKA